MTQQPQVAEIFRGRIPHQIGRIERLLSNQLGSFKATFLAEPPSLPHQLLPPGGGGGYCQREYGTARGRMVLPEGGGGDCQPLFLLPNDASNRGTLNTKHA